MKPTVRTFVAAETSEAVRDRAAALVEILKTARADVKWVERHNLHLTLKFLDEVPTDDIPAVSEAVQAVAAGVEPFEFGLRTCGAFPNPGRPRTLWLGAGGGREQMLALQREIEAALAKLGFPKEPRRFEPHLTLGRVRGGGPATVELGKLLRQHAEFDAGSFPVAEVVVFSSELGPKGPTYQAMARARLGGR